MIDIYIREFVLTKIISNQKHDLYFENPTTSEIVELVVDNEELVNILELIKTQCETLDLINRVHISRIYKEE